MTLLDNATFEFYTTALGRSEVPDEATFNKHSLENRLYVKSLLDDGLISERGENGIASAVCLMVEEDYRHAKTLSGEGAPKTSETIGGYSYSASTKAHDAEVERDKTTLAERKHKWLSLFCDITAGVP